MEKMLDTLLEQLFEATNRLEQAVVLQDSDVDEWLEILNEREALIAQMKDTNIVNEALTTGQRQRLSLIDEVNQRLLAAMDSRKQGVQKQLNNVQRSKLAMNSYYDMGPSGYGAFFDRKK
ncbi:flagellar protein FliT [Brevibacillus sp. SAFN-007a]|uniref:flagellar protein FliT n=1 Tax=Brevibacillus sp. SAFN-007a TaxID=3436862 RepID=UPI003F80514B